MSQAEDRKERNLFTSIVLNIIITVAQVIGGIISGSLSLLSDALHNFSDVLSLTISFFASRLTKRKASIHKTFGYKRAEIIAAFINAATLIIVSVLLILEAIRRFRTPYKIESDLVIWLSLLAILINGFSVLLLKSDSKKNINIKSAYIHLLTDMMASVAVLIGGLLMKYFNVFWIDSFLTLCIAIYLVFIGYNLLKESLKVLMQFTPQDIDLASVVTDVCKIPEIKNMHHIHIWQLNEQEIHLEAHVDFNADIKLSQFDKILMQIEKLLQSEYGINHVNIQPEFGKSETKDLIVQD